LASKIGNILQLLDLARGFANVNDIGSDAILVNDRFSVRSAMSNGHAPFTASCNPSGSGSPNT
jgi:hypothetical protein